MATSSAIVSGYPNLGDGTVSAPGLAFQSDSDTGIYRIGANTIGIATNGTRVGEIGVGYGGFTGNVIQVASVNNTYSIGTSSTSPQPSGHKITFTAKYSNSKLYFTLSAMGLYNNDGWIFLRIRNNTSASYIHTTEFGRYSQTISNGTITVNLLVNAPNTSANEYEIYYNTNNSAGTATYGAGYLCALTVMEIQQ